MMNCIFCYRPSLSGWSWLVVGLAFWLIGRFPAQAQAPADTSRGRVYGYNVKPLVPGAPADSFPADVQLRLQQGDDGVSFYRDMLLFSEPSTISPYGLDHTGQCDQANQKKMFVLNADIRPVIALGGRARGLGHFGLGGLGRFVHTVHVIPRFRVRIFQDDPAMGDSSLPVRTPSYMPGLQYFISTRGLWRQHGLPSDADRNKFSGRLRRTKWYGTFYAYHHSDGQDGSEFYPATSKVPSARIGAVNTYNGNFSELVVFETGIGGTFEQDIYVSPKNGRLRTNVLKRLLRIRPADTARVAQGSPDDDPPLTIRNFRSRGERVWYWQGTYEWHGKNLTNKAYAAYQVYGRHRLNLRCAYIYAPILRNILFSDEKQQYYAANTFQQVERHRFILNASYILDNHFRTGETIYALSPVGWFDPSKRLNVDLAYHWRIPGTAYTSLFTQVGYYGSDPYNVYFQQSFWFARAGLALGFFRYNVQPVLRP